MGIPTPGKMVFILKQAPDSADRALWKILCEALEIPDRLRPAWRAINPPIKTPVKTPWTFRHSTRNNKITHNTRTLIHIIYIFISKMSHLVVRYLKKYNGQFMHLIAVVFSDLQLGWRGEVSPLWPFYRAQHSSCSCTKNTGFLTPNTWPCHCTARCSHSAINSFSVK